MPLTDMDILQRAFDIEGKGSQMGWTYWAVGAGNNRRLTGLVEEGMLQILWKNRGETAYRLTEKGKGFVAVAQEQRQQQRIPAATIVEALALVKGFDDLKETIASVIEGQKRLHFLLSGPPASAKSLFLTGVQSAVGPERSYLAFGSRTSAAGLSEMLFEHQPDVFLADEIDKMRNDTLSVLLGLMETGDVVETKSQNRRGIHLETTVIAACNRFDHLPPEVMSRFAMHAQFEPYSRDEFLDVSEHFLYLTEGCDPELAREIGAQVFDRELGDVRKVRSVWQLMDQPTRPSMFSTISLMEKYGGRRQNGKAQPASARLL